MNPMRMFREAAKQAAQETIGKYTQPAIDLGNLIEVRLRGLQKSLDELEPKIRAALVEAIETIQRERDMAIAVIRAASRP